MGNKVNVYINREFKKKDFHSSFLNWNISVIDCGNLMKFDGHVVRV